MTSKLTREENVQAVFDLKAGYTLGLADVEILKRVARMALAAMDSEPVAEVVSIYGDPEAFGEREIRPLVGIQQMPYGTKLYRHAQHPVAPDNSAITQYFDTIALETAREIMCDVNRRHEFLGGEIQLLSRIQCRIDNACRAAMLQDADGKPELTVWYGAMPETNGKTNWTAILHREGQHPWEGITIDLSEYPDRVRYEADRMRHLIGELADEPDILAYDAEAHSGYVYPGNSPVIPEGWTGNDKTNAALMMLDRIETVDPVDDDRIDGIKRIVRELAAAQQEVK